MAPGPQPSELARPSLVDTAVWAWARDHRFPAVTDWFNGEVRAGRVLLCELIVLELVRLAPSWQRARQLSARVSAFEMLPMPPSLWSRAQEVQLSMAVSGDHRRVTANHLLIAATAELAGVSLTHYDRDYERIVAVTGQTHAWFLPEGTLAA